MGARGDQLDWDAATNLCRREAARVVRDVHDAEDAAQEAVLRAWRRRSTLRTRESADAWMRVVARNAALDLAVSRRRIGSRETLERAPVERGLEDPDLLGTDDRLVFESLLAALDPPTRELLRLRYLEDLNYPEIADRLDMPVGTVKVRLHRLRGRLQTLIEARHEPA